MTEPAAKREKRQNGSDQNADSDDTPALRIGGVPEHFNYPWRMASKQGIFDSFDVKADFVEQRLGTGAMVAAAKDGSLDVIVALTEGLVADIANGSDLRLLGTYVASPLCWAISVGANSDIKDVEDLRDGTFAVSRMGSGSHLMACVLAHQRGWDVSKIKFHVAGDINALCDAVNSGKAQAFLWETFTTKPYHDEGRVARIGDITTPWPCFMLAARQSVITERLPQLQRALAAIHQAAQMFHAQEDTMPGIVASEYGLKSEDASSWYSGVTITAERFVSASALDRAVEFLKLCNILPQDKTYDVETFIDSRVGQLKQDIASMKLYERSDLVTAIHRQLAHAGLSKGAIHYQQLLPFDQHHYHGVDAVEGVIKKAGIKASSRIINIGSGLGGPARYFAGKVGCQVLAVELQEDLSRTANELTSRCQLEKQVHHVNADFMQISQHLQHSAYDAIVSWLTVLHFADRVSLFRRCYELLRPGGIFFAADFFQAGMLSHDDLATLRDRVGCPALAGSVDIYRMELETAGFKIVSLDDVTADWKEYTAKRVANFEQQQPKLASVIGQDIFDDLRGFYATVRDLYAGGGLGGLEVVAMRPLGW